MKRAYLGLVAVLLTVPGTAADVSFDYENFWKTPTGAFEVVLRFTNRSSRLVTYIGADCALLGRDGKALTMIRLNAVNIGPDDHAFSKGTGGTGFPVEKAECRISAVDYQ